MVVHLVVELVVVMNVNMSLKTPMEIAHSINLVIIDVFTIRRVKVNASVGDTEIEELPQGIP